jgi:hypothetical protein
MHKIKLISIVRVAIWLSCLVQLFVQIDCRGPKDLKQKLNEHCKRKLKFKTIARYNNFVRELKTIEASGPIQLDKDLGYLALCLAEKESLYALQELMENYDKDRPCKYSEVTKLEEYAKKYLLNNTKARALKFFTYFGVTVGMYCRTYLMAHLKQADSEVEPLDFIYSTASPTGWNTLINEYTSKSLKFGVSTNEENSVINKVARLVPGLTQIDQLEYLDFHHAMDDVESSQYANFETGSHKVKNITLKPQIINSLNKIIESCVKLEKFYLNSVLSMAKLKNLGLSVDFLNGLHDRSALLHKWLVAASFCQLMVRVKIITTDNEATNHVDAIDYELVHNDARLKSRLELYSYAAPFDEIHEKAPTLSLQAQVNEAAWRQKNEAMWPSSKAKPAISVAMRLLVQYIKGVENDFKQGL